MQAADRPRRSDVRELPEFPLLADVHRAFQRAGLTGRDRPLARATLSAEQRVL